MRLLAVAATIVAASCASPPGGFDSPEPAARLSAITKAAETGDRSAIPRLIESLESDDPVVRLASIRTLEQMTGQTLGYEHFDPEWKRKEAIKAWVEWYKAHPEAGTAERRAGLDRKPPGPAYRNPGRDRGPARRLGRTPARPIRGIWG